MIPIRGHKASHSSMEWVVRMTLVRSSGGTLPPDTRSLTSCQISRRATGSTPVEHSSRKTIWGWPIMAQANDRRRFIPPLYPAASLSQSSSLKPTFANSSAAACLTKSFGMPLIAAYSSTCSRPVKLAKWASNCGQYPTRRRVFSGCVVTLKPAKVASPLVGGNSAVSMLIVVVFPAPLIPKRPKHSPGAIPRDMLFTAILLLLYTLVI
mmetsp:Transcript_15760/g.36140  ORF Transcript_15760/g.36140 Transcript_15760/m.36140 type:complete len:209 (+) Transcript_15760:529-1155(+)